MNGLTFAMPERSWMFSFKVQSVPTMLRKGLQGVPIKRKLHRTDVSKIIGIERQDVPIKLGNEG